MANKPKKGFWKRPEGVTGAIFMTLILAGVGSAVFFGLPYILGSVALMTVALVVLGLVLYTAIDPKARNMVWYMYKSVMRSITSFFVKVDPIAILKSYISELKGNLRKMNIQISKLRGQIHKLKEIIHNNNKQIQSNLELASKAKANNKAQVMILKSRKAGRLRESNVRLEDLERKMEVLYRVLTKMYQNSQILMEDISDQVEIKEVEQKMIHSSHSAMNSAMSVINGDPDKRAMFDMAMEAVAEDVGNKVGEMERFMSLSSNFMESIDLQNGVFEEEGLRMLEEWEQKGTSLILGDEDKANLLLAANDDNQILDLNSPVAEPVRADRAKNQYDTFFED